MKPLSGKTAEFLNFNVKGKVRLTEEKPCNYCLDVSFGAKIVYGIDIKFRIGFN